MHDDRAVLEGRLRRALDERIRPAVYPVSAQLTIEASFLEEFGIENDEAWLPDTFGFAAGLPQAIKAAGSKRLLTQKIPWSQVNSSAPMDRVCHSIPEGR